jgi:hypothetical protein
MRCLNGANSKAVKQHWQCWNKMKRNVLENLIVLFAGIEALYRVAM